MKVLLANGQVVNVRTGGSSEGYRDEDPPGGVKWSPGDGLDGAYIDESYALDRGLDENRLTRGRADLIRTTKVTIAGESASVGELVPGDVLTYRYGGVEQSRPIWDVRAVSVLGLVTHIDLVLEPA